MWKLFLRACFLKNDPKRVVFERIVLPFALPKKEMEMKLKIAVTALVISLSPAIASAMCSSIAPAQTASSCLEGQVWDAESATCITPMSS